MVQRVGDRGQLALAVVGIAGDGGGERGTHITLDGSGQQVAARVVGIGGGFGVVGAGRGFGEGGDLVVGVIAAADGAGQRRAHGFGFIVQVAVAVVGIGGLVAVAIDHLGELLAGIVGIGGTAAAAAGCRAARTSEA